LAGIVSGLTPGIHINLVSVLVVSLSPKLSGLVSPLSLVVFIVSMGITHTFLDFIPSIFLGVPDAEKVKGFKLFEDLNLSEEVKEN
jgi:putative membrane protein